MHESTVESMSFHAEFAHIKLEPFDLMSSSAEQSSLMHYKSTSKIVKILNFSIYSHICVRLCNCLTKTTVPTLESNWKVSRKIPSPRCFIANIAQFQAEFPTANIHKSLYLLRHEGRWTGRSKTKQRKKRAKDFSSGKVLRKHLLITITE